MMLLLLRSEEILLMFPYFTKIVWWQNVQILTTIRFFRPGLLAVSASKTEKQTLIKPDNNPNQINDIFVENWGE
jgi:hypothetical protein